MTTDLTYNTPDRILFDLCADQVYLRLDDLADALADDVSNDYASKHEAIIDNLINTIGTHFDLAYDHALIMPMRRRLADIMTGRIG